MSLCSNKIKSFTVIPNSFLKHFEKYFGVLNPTFADSSTTEIDGFSRNMRHASFRRMLVIKAVTFCHVMARNLLYRVEDEIHKSKAKDSRS